jgi:glycosyltransferase involved in cell wall biosynthesis
LPEINDDRIGWLIDLPKDEYGVVRTGGKGFNQKVSARITDGIISIMEALCASPEQVRDKGERAHRRIAADFSPARKAEELTALYSAALAGTESRQGVRSPAGEASGGPAKSH